MFDSPPQFLVVARDRGTPSRTSDNATVNIEVIRNDNPPRFQRNTQTAAINQVRRPTRSLLLSGLKIFGRISHEQTRQHETPCHVVLATIDRFCLSPHLKCSLVSSHARAQNQQIGNRIAQVQAEDADSADSFGTIRFRIIGDDSAPEYFDIDPVSGDIRLKESVVEDTRTEYQVSPGSTLRRGSEIFHGLKGTRLGTKEPKHLVIREPRERDDRGSWVVREPVISGC